MIQRRRSRSARDFFSEEICTYGSTAVPACAVAPFVPSLQVRFRRRDLANGVGAGRGPTWIISKNRYISVHRPYILMP
jgi:hypothetical protein